MSSTSKSIPGIDVQENVRQSSRHHGYSTVFSFCSRDVIGHRVESFSMQLITVILIYLDFVACAVIAILDLMDLGGNLQERLQPTAASNSPMGIIDPSSVGRLCSSQLLCSFSLYILKSFTGFTIVYLTFEIIAVVYAFGYKKVYAHLGYTTDVIIVSMLCICSVWKHKQEMSRHGRTKNVPQGVFSSWSNAIMYCGAIRLLGCLRIWRLVRFVTLVLDDTLDTLEKSQEELSIAREAIESKSPYSSQLIKTSHDQTSTTIQTLRLEIETLEEALRIAAVDMAAYRNTTDAVNDLVSKAQNDQSWMLTNDAIEDSHEDDKPKMDMLPNAVIEESQVIDKPKMDETETMNEMDTQ